MVLFLISANRRGFPGCTRKRKRQEGSSFPSALVSCAWGLSSSPEAGVDGCVAARLFPLMQDLHCLSSLRKVFMI